MNFDLYLPVEVIFGVGSVNKVGEVGRRFGYRVLIATGKKSTKENGALDRVALRQLLQRWALIGGLEKAFSS